MTAFITHLHAPSLVTCARLGFVENVEVSYPLGDQGDGQSWKAAPGNLYCAPVQMEISRGARLSLLLDQVMPEIAPPEDTPYIKHVTIKSELLSEFCAPHAPPPSLWRSPARLSTHETCIGDVGEIHANASEKVLPSGGINDPPNPTAKLRREHFDMAWAPCVASSIATSRTSSSKRNASTSRS